MLNTPITPGEKMRCLKKVFLLIFFTVLSAISPFEGFAQTISGDFAHDPQSVRRGEVLFQQHCASCHNFKQKGIGPNLSGVTARQSYSWLFQFVRNPEKVIASNDVHAKALFEEYKVAMPSFVTLNDEQVRQILSFVHTQKAVQVTEVSSPDFGEPIKDPIPTKIPQSGLVLDLQLVNTAPPTSTQIPLARINQMRVLSGKKERVFLSDLRGLLYEMKGKDLNVVMDIREEFPAFIPAPGLATGFGSYAFHPEFYKNGLFYTTHTEKAKLAAADFYYADSIPVALQWVLTEWKIDDPRGAVFKGTHRELMRINMFSPVHGVQEIIFNPLARKGSDDYGLLYIGVGDGGTGEAGYHDLCNNNRYVWSKILRIDPLGANSNNGQYGIPSNNPFARLENVNFLGEIFASGFRNPNRISWSPDGKMLIGEIGLSNIEELNLGKAGANYGWPAREGTFLLNYQGKMDRVYALPKQDSGYTYPVAQFDHDEGNAFSAGFVYNGKIALLKGKYIFGDVVSGRVFYVENKDLKLGQQAEIKELKLTFEGKPAIFKEITGNAKTDLRIGVGQNWEMYLYTKTDGKIWRIKAASKLL